MSPESTHKLMRVYMEVVIAVIYTSVYGFCFFKLFRIGCIELNPDQLPKLPVRLRVCHWYTAGMGCIVDNRYIFGTCCDWSEGRQMYLCLCCSKAWHWEGQDVGMPVAGLKRLWL